MNESRRKALLWRVPLVTALLVALFWGIYYLITGSVPVVTSVQWESKTIQIPFAISRWTDVFFTPLWAFILIVFSTDRRVLGCYKGEYSPRLDLVTVLIVGLTFGLLIGSFIGLGYGAFFGLFYGLLVELFVVLVMVLLAALTTVLGVGLIAIIKFIFSRSTWQTGWHWLIAADKQ